MKKTKTVYVCSECDYQSAKWMGRCPGCGNWNTFVEETYENEVPQKESGATRRQTMLARSARRGGTAAAFFRKTSGLSAALHRNRRVRPRTRRGPCRGLRRTALRRAGNRKIHASSANLCKSCGRPHRAVCFGEESARRFP